MDNIKLTAQRAGIPEDLLIPYGLSIAKVDFTRLPGSGKQGKLILVTALTPTKFGEGKTTMSIGLADALARLGKRTILCLREPSLGPVFSQKGGAAGGGKASVEPSEDINLHFTGDIHAVTSAHNLIAAEIDNHIFWGNELGIKEVLWKRAIDLCDRSLRGNFIITAASELMAVLCLARNEEDLGERIARIVVAVDTAGNPVTVGMLGSAASVLRLLKKALLPNLVRTAEGTPAFVHGGPFANIAHGANSIIATGTALSLADYVVTEAGFGSDLGAVKFFDIVAPAAGLDVNAVVIVATTRAIGLNGLENLGRHAGIVRALGARPVIVLNKFQNDTSREIDKICSYAKSIEAPIAISTAFDDGGQGSIALAELVISQIDENPRRNAIYAENESFKQKADALVRKILGGAGADILPIADTRLAQFAGWGFGGLPICLAKTQYSLTDNKDIAGAPSGFTIEISDASLAAGAGFVVLKAGKILTMPGMPKKNS